MPKIAVCGLGKLGLPVSVAIAQKFPVIGYDVDPWKMRHRSPYEHRELGPTLEDDFQKYFDVAYSTGMLRFASLLEAVAQSDIIFVAVQTPHQPKYDGSGLLPLTRADFDYTYLVEACKSLAPLVRPEQTVAIISTVLPGTVRREVLPVIGGKCKVVFNPFFIAMNSVMHDYMNPEFVLIGADNRPNDDDESGYGNNLWWFYREFYDKELSLIMSIESAELVKTAYNTAITAKICQANTIMEIAHKTPGCDVDDVTDALKCATDRIVSTRYMTAGMGDGGACLVPGTPVMTINGPRPIETIEQNDMVLSGDGCFHPVVKRWEREYDGEVATICINGLPPTVATTNHEIYAATDMRGYYKTNLRGQRKIRRQSFPIAGCLSPIKKVPAGDLYSDQWIPWPIPTQQQERPAHATDEYCWLLGWYLSEGCLYLGKNGKRGGRVSFHLHKKELAIAEQLASTMIAMCPPKTSGQGAGAKATLYTQGTSNGLSVRYGSVKLARMLYADCGSGAFTKYLPTWALWADERTSRIILEGMFKGDGHINQHRTTFTTVSPHLAYGVFMMLERLSIGASMRCIQPRVSAKGQKHATSYEIRTGNLVDVRKLWDAVSLGDVTREQEKLYTRYPVIDGSRFHPVISADKSHYCGLVYNLWVRDTNNYVAPCGLISNCHPRDLIAMSWLADKLKMRSNIFDDLAMSREKQAEWLVDLLIQHGEGLPKVILGTAFKAESNITAGSAAILCGALLKCRGMPFVQYDPFVDGVVQHFGRAWCENSKDVCAYLIATKHKAFQDWNFQPGSVVIDPFRYIKPQNGVTVIPVGVGANP